jgi:hypothetical protein
MPGSGDGHASNEIAQSECAGAAGTLDNRIACRRGAPGEGCQPLQVLPPGPTERIGGRLVGGLPVEPVPYSTPYPSDVWSGGVPLALPATRPRPGAGSPNSDRIHRHADATPQQEGAEHEEKLIGLIPR